MACALQYYKNCTEEEREAHYYDVDDSAFISNALDDLSEKNNACYNLPNSKRIEK